MRYECTEGNHNKYWEYEEPIRHGSSWGVRVTWGKIGTVGGTQEKIFESLNAAEDFITDKIYEKETKGYREVSQQSTRHESNCTCSIHTDIWDIGTAEEVGKKAKGKTASPKSKREKEGIDVIDFDLIAEPVKKKVSKK
jgi:predicted DNA-binding WGR domain protein